MSYYIVNNNYAYSNNYATGDVKGKLNSGNALKCKKCNKYISKLEWLQPFNIKVNSSKVGDFIFGTFNDLIVSEKFKDLYLKSNLFGISEFLPVNVYIKNSKVSTLFYLPKIILENTRIDFKKSNISIINDIEYCDLCQLGGIEIKYMNGIKFENEDNFKYDIFKSIFVGKEIVSEKFLQFVESNNLTNLEVIECKNYIPKWILGNTHN